MRKIKTNFLNFVNESMKGEITLKDGMWYVKAEDGEMIPLHYDDVEEIKDMAKHFDNIEARILSSPHVDYDLVENKKMSGISKYAKLKHF